MLKMQVAIQCTDTRTGECGSFGFGQGTQGESFYSLTPVFLSVADLYLYMNRRGIVEDRGTWRYERSELYGK